MPLRFTGRLRDSVSVSPSARSRACSSRSAARPTQVVAVGAARQSASFAARRRCSRFGLTNSSAPATRRPAVSPLPIVDARSIRLLERTVDVRDASAGSVSEGPSVADAVQSFLMGVAARPVDQLADIELLAADAARDAAIFIADYAQQNLGPLGAGGERSVVSVDATSLGRVFQSGEIYCDDQRVIAPLIEGRERLGVVEYHYDRDPPARSSSSAPSVGRCCSSS